MRNNSETKELIKNILWDVDISSDEVLLMIGDKKRINESRRFIVRLLKSYSWYTLLKIFTIEEMIEIINDNKVIDSIFPQSLKEKYKNAREILH